MLCRAIPDLLEDLAAQAAFAKSTNSEMMYGHPTPMALKSLFPCQQIDRPTGMLKFAHIKLWQRK